MKIKIVNIIYILLFFKYFSPFMAVVYLGCWLIQAFNQNLFKFIDLFFGILPHLFDKFARVETELFGSTVTMGYVHSACVFVAFFYFSNILIVKAEKLEKIQKNEELKKRIEKKQAFQKLRQAELEKQKKERVEKQVDSEPLPLNRKMFFGLFEFQLEYFQVYGKNPSDLRKLNIEYSRIMSKKLKEKYPDVEFMTEDKIFFVCKDFSKFGIFTKDVLTLFKTIMQTNMIQSIKTGMSFSYWAADDLSNKDEIFRILTKINELGYVNKIIVSSGIYFRFQMEEYKKHFAFDPLGASKLSGVYEDKDIDFDIELYSITKVE